MPFNLSNPLGLRRNTFSGDGNRETAKPGERNDPRGMDNGESLRRALGENFRDTDDAKRVTPATYRKDLTAVYSEPLYLGLPCEPGGICLMRLRLASDDRVRVPGAGWVFFVWDGPQSRAAIYVDGLTPDGSIYRFNFYMVG